MTFISTTFGQTGTAIVFFAGQWWMVGMFLILIFALYFYGANIPREGLILFLASSFLLASIDNIFEIPQEYQLTIIIPVLIFIAIILYGVINR